MNFQTTHNNSNNFYPSVFFCDLARIPGIGTTTILFLSKLIYEFSRQEPSIKWIDFAQDVVREKLSLTNAQIKYSKKKLLELNIIELSELRADGIKLIKLNTDVLLQFLPQFDTSEIKDKTISGTAGNLISHFKTQCLFYKQLIDNNLTINASLLLQTIIYMSNKTSDGVFFTNGWIKEKFCMSKSAQSSAVKLLINEGLITTQRLKRRGKVHYFVEPRNEKARILLSNMSFKNTSNDKSSANAREKLSNREEKINNPKEESMHGQEANTAQVEVQNQLTKILKDQNTKQRKNKKSSFTGKELFELLLHKSKRQFLSLCPMISPSTQDQFLTTLGNTEYEVSTNITQWQKWFLEKNDFDSKSC